MAVMLVGLPVPVVPPAHHTGHRDTPVIAPAPALVKPVASVERHANGDAAASVAPAPPGGVAGLADTRGEDPPPPSPPRDSYPRAPPPAV